MFAIDYPPTHKTRRRFLDLLAEGYQIHWIKTKYYEQSLHPKERAMESKRKGRC
jgi:hypothetical protein